MSIYEPLNHFLSRQSGDEIAMSFAEVEGLLGFTLPYSARAHRPWWANSHRGKTMSYAWLEAGYRTRQVEMAGERLVFARQATKPKQVGAIDEQI